MNHTLRNILIAFLAIFLLAGSFCGGLITGWIIPDSSALENNLQTNIAATPTTVGDTTDTTQLFTPFWEAWQIVHDQYIDQPVDDTKLMQGAIRGMMDALGDEHSSYMSPDEYEEANTSLGAAYGGIGAYVDVDGDYLTITKPMEGYPADKAGLLAGDEVIAVDGKDMTGIDPNTVLLSVKGPEGTNVTLTIYRPDTDTTFDVVLTREAITVPTVSGEMLDQNIAYISITSFGDNATTEDLKAQLTDLLAQNPKGLILDLRYNSGGYLDTAIEVVSQFIGDGVVMYEEQSNGQMDAYNAIPGGIATKIPLVVLVNEYSASASEITAGAIQDFGRGVLVGTQTYGKGSVQNWVPLDDNQGAVRVTVARWLTPLKRQINGEGLTPDYTVELTDEDIKNQNDTQLNKAIEILLSN